MTVKISFSNLECFVFHQSELNSILDKLYPLALSLPNQIHHDVVSDLYNGIKIIHYENTLFL